MPQQAGSWAELCALTWRPCLSSLLVSSYGRAFRTALGRSSMYDANKILQCKAAASCSWINLRGLRSIYHRISGSKYIH